MLDISIQCIGVDADTPDEAATQAGAAPHVHLQIVGGTDLPFSAPGSNRPLRVPTTSVRFELTKQAAEQLGDLLKEKAADLPDGPSGKLAIASSMADIEGVAGLDKLKG